MIKNKFLRKKQGWATIELISLMPLFTALLSLLLYFTQVALLRLKLESVTRDAARYVALNEGDCSQAEEVFIHSFENRNHLDYKCKISNNFISISTDYTYKSSIPFFDLTHLKIKAESVSLKEGEI